MRRHWPRLFWRLDSISATVPDCIKYARRIWTERAPSVISILLSTKRKILKILLICWVNLCVMECSRVWKSRPRTTSLFRVDDGVGTQNCQSNHPININNLQIPSLSIDWTLAQRFQLQSYFSNPWVHLPHYTGDSPVIYQNHLLLYQKSFDRTTLWVANSDGDGHVVSRSRWWW